MQKKDDPVGKNNKNELRKIIEYNSNPLVICAWGTHGSYLNQNLTMMKWLKEMGINRPKALGVTADGHPRHPLYLRNDTSLIDFKKRRA